MTDDVTRSVDREGLLDEAVASYLQAAEAGGAADRQQWLARYAEVAGELEHFFARNEQFGRLAEPLRLLATADPAAEGAAAEGLGRLGDFRLLREVGRGGMGVVYEAEQISLGRRVALKVLPLAATMDARHLRRFENEARAAASLHHPHIVPVHAVGCERAVHYYAMQFIDGRTLAEVIADRRQGGLVPQPTAPYLPAPADEAPPPAPSAATTTPKGREATSKAPSDAAYFRRVAEWGVQAADALENAHGLGIVHRDVKPGNLMIDGQGKLWVTDFGLARTAADSGLTVTGDVLGTLRYMSPEQALAKHGLVDHRTDVYSLGATLYELATLEPAVGGKDRAEVFRRVIQEEPVAPRILDRGIPAELEVIILKAMAKEPRERYATAGELADDLRRWLEDRPILARRPGAVQRLRKWGRRHRSVVFAGVSVVGIVLVSLAVVLWLVWQQNQNLSAAYHSEVAARSGEAEQRQRAEDRFKKASEAIENIYNRVASDEELLDLAPMQQLRKDALLEVLAFYQGFLRDKDTDPSVRYETAYAYRRVGEIHRGLSEIRVVPQEQVPAYRSSKLQEAESATREALSRQEALVDEYPGEPKYRAELANVYRNMAMIEMMRTDGAVPRTKEVENRYRQCLALCEQLVADFPKEAAYRRVLGWAYHSLAIRLGAMQGDKEAMMLYQSAVKTFEGLVADYHSLEDSLVLAEFHRNLQDFYGNRGRREQAETEWQRERAILADVEARYPGNVEALSGLANAYNIRGNRLQRTKRLAEAEAAYRKALQFAEKLSSGEAVPTHRRATEANVLRSLGDLGRDGGRPREAEAAYRKAATLSEALLASSPNTSGYKRNCIDSWTKLAELLAHEGRLKEAIQSCQRTVSVLEGMVAQSHSEAGYKNDLGNARGRLIELLTLAGNFTEAVTQQRRVVSDYEERTTKSPELHNLQGLARGQFALAKLLHSAGDRAEAERVQRRGLATTEKALCTPLYLSRFYWFLRAGDLFFLAKAYWQLGEKEKARRWYDEGVRWKAEYDPQDTQWLPTRLEAAVLLGVKHLGPIDDRLSAVLNGTAQPKDAAERIIFAQICQEHRKDYIASARFYAEAFDEKPQLAGDLRAQFRYNAACAAALAGCGKGKDAAGLDDKEGARLRKQALDWLRSDLEAYRKLREKEPEKARAVVTQRLHHWQQDGDLAGLRDAEPMARLPAAERDAWQQLWADVAKALSK